MPGDFRSLVQNPYTSLIEENRKNFGQGSTIKDFVDIKAEGSKGKEADLINAVAKLNIPITEKLKLVNDITYGKIKVPEFNFKQSDFDQNIGLEYNKDGEGLSAGVRYNTSTKKPEGFIGIRKTFAGGTGSDEESYGDLIDAYEKGIMVLPGESLTEYINRIRNINQKANGGRIGLEGGTTKLGNVVDMRNIPYYASKTVEGAVNAGEVLSKLPFAVGNLASKLLQQKPNKEMFLSALNNIKPGSFSDAIGLADLIARQEQDLSPQAKTMGSQLSLTSETFVPVGAAVNIGSKVLKTASKKLGKEGPKLEKLVEERLTDMGQSRRDFNTMVATTGLMAALKSLGITGLASKAAKKVDDIKVSLKQNSDGWYEDEDLVGVSNLHTYITPLTDKGKKILEKLKLKKDTDGDFFFDNSEDALVNIDKIKKQTDNIALETDINIRGEQPGNWKTGQKIYRQGDNPQDVFNEASELTTSNPYGPDEYWDQFTGEIVDTILSPRKVKFSGGGKVYGKYAKQIISS